MGWTSKEARSERRHRKELLRAQTEEIAALLLATAEWWGRPSAKSEVAEEAARIAHGDRRVIGEVCYHPAVKKAREVLKHSQPLIGQSKLNNHEYGMVLFVAGFHSWSETKEAFDRYQETNGQAG
jgi:hypothetical protein